MKLNNLRYRGGLRQSLETGERKTAQTPHDMLYSMFIKEYQHLKFNFFYSMRLDQQK